MRFDNLVDEAQQSMEPVKVVPQPLPTNNTGICLSCEEPIPLKRRKAIPNVDLCLECQEYAEYETKVMKSRGYEE